MIFSDEPFRDAVWKRSLADVGGSGFTGSPGDVPIGGAFTLFVTTSLKCVESPGLLAALNTGDGTPVCVLTLETSGSALQIVCAFRTDFSDRPLTLTVSNAALGAAETVALTLRYTGPNLHLFVDGVLVDEEWPAGNLHGDGHLTLHAATGFASASRIAVWDRPLGDDEIAGLSGGVARVEERRREILGEEPPGLTYWKPRGDDTGVGDCMPFFFEGRFHLSTCSTGIGTRASGGRAHTNGRTARPPT